MYLRQWMPTVTICKWKLIKQTKRRRPLSSHRGLYELTNIPFSLIKAVFKFQRALYVFLSIVKRQHALFYLDDVVIFCKTFKNHIAHKISSLFLLSDSDVTPKLSKYAFFNDTVHYLVRMIRPKKWMWRATPLLPRKTRANRGDRAKIISSAFLYFRRIFTNCAKILWSLSKRKRGTQQKDVGLPYQKRSRIFGSG